MHEAGARKIRTKCAKNIERTFLQKVTFTLILDGSRSEKRTWQVEGKHKLSINKEQSSVRRHKHTLMGGNTTLECFIQGIYLFVLCVLLNH